MDVELKNTAMATFGYSDAQAEGLSAKQQAIIKASPARRAYKMIMEVVAAENCAYKPKIGDRYVTTGSGKLLPEECTFPICLWALAPMLPISYVVYDRLTHGLDPNGHVYDHMKCADTGVGCGGLGEVAFKVYCEPA